MAAAEFLDSNAADKRSKLIDGLLASPHFGEQWGRTWRDWIAPPELPSDPNSGKQPHQETQNLGRWLAERANAGDAWDKIVREILTADGELKNKPQVIFFGLSGEGGKPTAGGAARAVGSLFLGVQLQCAECHDDPYRDWAQREYWALAAFFRRTNGDFNKISDQPDAKNKGDDGAMPGKIAIPKSAFLNAGTWISASFLSADQAADQPSVSRERLAEWLTARDNPYFARAFVNRTWFHFFSRGIVNPVDDLRELNPPSHPELMKLLADDFTASGFDIRRLMRVICNSETYQRTSRVVAGAEDTAIAAQTSAFGRMPLRVIQADSLFDSLKAIFGDPKFDLRAIDPKNGNTNGESAPVGDAYLEFLRRFGTNEDDATDFTHGVPQMLSLLNHPRLLAGSKALEERLKKADPAWSEAQVIDWLYLSTLSRRPTAEETAEAAAYCARSVDPPSARAGVLWMLVNRSEFLLLR